MTFVKLLYDNNTVMGNTSNKIKVNLNQQVDFISYFTDNPIDIDKVKHKKPKRNALYCVYVYDVDKDNTLTIIFDKKYKYRCKIQDFYYTPSLSNMDQYELYRVLRKYVKDKFYICLFTNPIGKCVLFPFLSSCIEHIKKHIHETNEQKIYLDDFYYCVYPYTIHRLVHYKLTKQNSIHQHWLLIYYNENFFE